MTINRLTLMNYAQNLEGDTLTDDEVKRVIWDYLMKTYEGCTKWPTWPKDIKDLCASKGIIQDKDTGLPQPYEQIESAWSTRAAVAEERLMAAAHMIERLESENQALTNLLKSGQQHVH